MLWATNILVLLLECLLQPSILCSQVKIEAFLLQWWNIRVVWYREWECSLVPLIHSRSGRRLKDSSELPRWYPTEQGEIDRLVDWALGKTVKELRARLKNRHVSSRGVSLIARGLTVKWVELVHATYVYLSQEIFIDNIQKFKTHNTVLVDAFDDAIQF